MTPADEIRDALAKMTPGEWQVRRDQCHFDTASDIACGNKTIGRTCSQYPQIEHDAAGIVTLRNKVPALLDELAAAKARADAWEADAARYASNAEYWKARADKAEAEVARLRAAAVKLDNAVAEYLDAERLWQSDQCEESVVNAAEAAMKSALYEARKTRAALEANDAGR